MIRADIVIVGAGIAGASLAAELAPHASVVILEAEDMPGYHATGRSAAFWSETYGGPLVQPLTTASGPALRTGCFLDPLGSIHIGRADDAADIEAFYAAFAETGVDLRLADPAAHVPGLRPEWTLGVFEPSCAYIDAAGLHADCLRRAKQAGATLLTRAALESAEHADGHWSLIAGGQRIACDRLVNAAGAWADVVAGRAGIAPLGITPLRRTMVQLRTDPPAPPGMPLVEDIAGRFYFRPEAGGAIWLTPADETPVLPGDAAPEELDIAIAIDRFEQAVDWRVSAVERKWAGLRSFAPDRLPIYGFDAANSAFFWCAGQGGFGIQTAPAAAMLAASMLLGQTPDPAVAHIDPAPYAPSRFTL